MAAPALFIDVRLLPQPVRFEPLAPFPPSAGGEAVFLGRTRADVHPVHGDLVRLCYDAYEPMALRMLNDLAADAAGRWDCLAIRIHHTVGEVPLGEASVLIQVACGHRDSAFQACRHLIDALKTSVPIWKREVWADGSTWSRGTPVTTMAAATRSTTTAAH